MTVKLLIAALRAPLSANLNLHDAIIQRMFTITPSFDDSGIENASIINTQKLNGPTDISIEESLALLLNSELSEKPLSIQVPDKIDLTKFDEKKAKEVFGDRAADHLKLLTSFLQDPSQVLKQKLFAPNKNILAEDTEAQPEITTIKNILNTMQNNKPVQSSIGQNIQHAQSFLTSLSTYFSLIIQKFSALTSLFGFQQYIANSKTEDPNKLIEISTQGMLDELLNSEALSEKAEQLNFDTDKAQQIFKKHTAEHLKSLLSLLQDCSNEKINLTEFDTKKPPKHFDKIALAYLLLLSRDKIDLSPFIDYPWGLGGVATVARTYAENSKNSPEVKSREPEKSPLKVLTFGYPGSDIHPKLRDIVVEKFGENYTTPVFVPAHVYNPMYSVYANALVWPIMHRYLKETVRTFRKLDAEKKAQLADNFRQLTTANVEKVISKCFASAKAWMVISNQDAANEEIHNASKLYVNYNLSCETLERKRLRPITQLGAENDILQEEYADIFPVNQPKRNGSWEAYKKSNQLFADQMFDNLKDLSNKEILKHIIWVNDYQLMLVPGMLRDRLVKLSQDRLARLAKERNVTIKNLKDDLEVKQIKDIASTHIAYFHHIPFPITSALRDIPKKEWVEILTSLKKADQIGFHVDEFANNFIQATKHYLNLNENETDELKQKAFGIPIGIDGTSFANNTTDEAGKHTFHAYQHNTYDQYSKIEKTDIIYSEDEFNFLKGIYTWKNKNKDRIIIGAVDRIDPSKGYIQRLSIIKKLLEDLSKRKGGTKRIKNLCFVMIAPNSRDNIPQYKNNRDKFIEIARKINFDYRDLLKGRDVINIFNSESQRPTVRALYRITDIHIATSYTDGFHLGPEEYLLTLIDHNKNAIEDSLLSMSLEDYQQSLKNNTADPKKTNIGVCVMSKGIGCAKTKLGKFALTYEPEDYDDHSASVGKAGAEQLLKAIRLIENPEHSEPLDDGTCNMTALQRTQAMQKFVLKHDMDYWAKRNIFGRDLSNVSEKLSKALHDIIHRGLQYLADGDDRHFIYYNKTSYETPPGYESDKNDKSDDSDTSTSEKHHFSPKFSQTEILSILQKAAKKGYDLHNGLPEKYTKQIEKIYARNFNKAKQKKPMWPSDSEPLSSTEISEREERANILVHSNSLCVIKNIASPATDLPRSVSLYEVCQPVSAQKNNDSVGKPYQSGLFITTDIPNDSYSQPLTPNTDSPLTPTKTI